MLGPERKWDLGLHGHEPQRPPAMLPSPAPSSFALALFEGTGQCEFLWKLGVMMDSSPSFTPTISHQARGLKSEYSGGLKAQTWSQIS